MKKNILDYLIKHGWIMKNGEIYGGLQNIWDYGHLGVLLKENIKKKWMEFFVLRKENAFLMDCAIFTHKNVLEASGHIQNFYDVLIDCKKCKKRFREDHIPDKICPNCKSNDWTDARNFNLMFCADKYYLRPETAQSIFINFKNFLNTHGATIPFSIGQIGKSFRNEVTIKNSIFRTREFEQMEIEHFVFPDDADNSFNNSLQEIETFLIEHLKLKKTSIKAVEIDAKDRAHYSKKSTDFFFNFENGFSELLGLANRGDYDLLSHQTHSKTAMHYFDTKRNQKIIPHVIEHSVGLNRLFLAIITDAYGIEENNEQTREILKIDPSLAPYKFAILPLTKNEISVAKQIFNFLISKNISVVFDQKGSIGKRYRKQDSIGTPLCITIDSSNAHDDLKEFIFSIRDRDTKKQNLTCLKKLIENDFKHQWI